MRTILFIISVVILFPGKVLPQNNDSLRLAIYSAQQEVTISLTQLYNYDSELLLKRNVINKQDSIIIYKVKNKFYFFFPVTDDSMKFYRLCMFYELDTNKQIGKLRVLERYSLKKYWWKGPKEQAVGTLPAYLFSDKILILRDNLFGDSDTLKKAVLILNPDNFTLQEFEYPDNDGYIDIFKSFIEGDKLFLFVRKTEERFNFWRLLTPREQKWKIYYVGNPFYYIFDKDFNFIEKKEIDEGHKYQRHRL